MVCLPVCYSCNDEFRSVPPPENSPEPLSKVLCPSCSVVRGTEYYKSKNYCWLYFFIPFPCGKERTFLGCKNCKYNLSRESITQCEECGVGCTFYSRHCPMCGKKNKY